MQIIITYEKISLSRTKCYSLFYKQIVRYYLARDAFRSVHASLLAIVSSI